MAVGDACVSWLSHTSTNTTFLSKATDYFSHMLLQRWEVKIRRKEKSPQPGIELTTTRSWVGCAHHWATRAESFIFCRPQMLFSSWTRLKFCLLNHSYSMTPFDASGKEVFWKHCRKRRNCLFKQFLLFPQCLLLYQRQKLQFLLYLICRLQIISVWSGPKFCCLVMGW